MPLALTGISRLSIKKSSGRGHRRLDSHRSSPFPIPSFPATYIRRDEGSTSSRDSGGSRRRSAPADFTERADGGQVPVSLCKGERGGEGGWIEGWGGGDAEEGVFGDEGDEERGGCVSFSGVYFSHPVQGELRGMFGEGERRIGFREISRLNELR